jgi:hypothetical protein
MAAAALAPDAAAAYTALTTRLRKLSDLDGVEATLQWVGGKQAYPSDLPGSRFPHPTYDPTQV